MAVVVVVGEDGTVVADTELVVATMTGAVGTIPSTRVPPTMVKVLMGLNVVLIIELDMAAGMREEAAETYINKLNIHPDPIQLNHLRVVDIVILGLLVEGEGQGFLRVMATMGTLLPLEVARTLMVATETLRLRVGINLFLIQEVEIMEAMEATVALKVAMGRVLIPRAVVRIREEVGEEEGCNYIITIAICRYPLGLTVSR